MRKDELQGFKELAGEMLLYDDAALKRAIQSGALIEVKSDDKDDEQGLSE